MREQAPTHLHRDGTRHRHPTVVSPEAVELLQQLEDFAAVLQPDAATALLRLLQCGLLVETSEHRCVGDDGAGYRPAWYRAYIAEHHKHRADGPSLVECEVFAYTPSWWPARTSELGAPLR